jgi:hypothetical protein
MKDLELFIKSAKEAAVIVENKAKALAQVDMGE